MRGFVCKGCVEKEEYYVYKLALDALLPTSSTTPQKLVANRPRMAIQPPFLAAFWDAYLPMMARINVLSYPITMTTHTQHLV